MDLIQTNISIKMLNTFQIDVKAKKYIQLKNTSEINELLHENSLVDQNYFIIGGGSNLLFTKDYDGLLIHPEFKGIQILKREGNDVYVEASAGESWDGFVTYCVNNNFGGAENLSLIPGSVGASAIQNIGAYGREAKDIVYQVKGYDLEKRIFKIFSNEECQFKYRSSRFKTEFGNTFLITSVVYKLTLEQHQLSYAYGALKSVIEMASDFSLKAIRKAVIAIREQKLPDPSKLGNAGSFFKNPVLAADVFNLLIQRFPEMPFFDLGDGMYKIPAGWMIETCGFKGYKSGNCGVHDKQALVLVNYGGASGKEILELSQEIKQSVSEQFNVLLEEEVIVL